VRCQTVQDFAEKGAATCPIYKKERKNGQVPWGGSQGVNEGAKKPILPQKAFYRKLTDIIVGNYLRMVEQILGESQEVNK